MLRRRLLLIAASLLACASVPPTPRPDPGAIAPPITFDVDAIDAYVADQVRVRGIVGASLVILRDGETVLSSQYGLASLATGDMVMHDTPFAIGSISKQFVCAAALLLAQDGKLTLDDTVAAYYPDLTRAADITLDDLGAHLSGYPDFYPLDFVDRRMREPIEPDELIRRYAGGSLEFEPRTRWSYSNTGFVLLGRIIETVAGRPLGEVLHERVFRPLRMVGTSFEPPTDAPGLAHGYIRVALEEPEPAPHEAAGWIHGAGGIYSTPRDVARWDLALVDGELLSPVSMQRFSTPRTLSDGRSTGYGCGIVVRRVGGETVLSHSGAVSGFLAFNAFIPRTRSAVVLFVNTDGGSPGEVHQQLLGLLVGPTTHVPEVKGPPPQAVARALMDQMQRANLDRTRLGAEFNAFYDDARAREAAPRLRALGRPMSVQAIEQRGRGGMEVTMILFVFAERTVKTLLYRTPDGLVQEFLLMAD